MGTNDNATGLGDPVVRPRACIVDDHAAVRQWLTQKLESLGVEICGVAETLEEGLATLTSQRPDLAVVDNRLPDGRGIDLCREISAQQPVMTLILHTGMISPLEESQAHEAGVTRIALKSIQGDDLLAAVEEFAVRHRAARD
ncbi:MAG: response regulator transcription factor [Nocardioides sp.]